MGGIILLLSQCHPDKKEYIVYKSKPQHLIDSFNRLSRSEQVKVCGSCHQQALLNEQLGPHANSFLKLREHLEFIKSDAYNDSCYVNSVKKRAPYCDGCHTSVNVYETLLLKLNKNQDSLPSLLKLLRLPLEARIGAEEGLKTGDDCLSCHYDGKNVVTNFNFKRNFNADCPSYCNPVGSKLFSSNTNCITCHTEETTRMSPTIAGKKVETNCLKCHQEYDNTGKGTHYIYWRNDSSNKPKPSRLIIFEDITAQYNTSNNQVIVSWNNSRLPHPLTLCTEHAAHFEVKDSFGNILGSGDIVLNRKKEYDSTLKPFYSKNKLPGKEGYQLPIDGTAIKDTIPLLQKPHSPLIVTITGTQKAQYWFPNSFKKTIYQRAIVLPSKQ